jgi:tetratricopeptide (TPR) repeat protein
MDKNTISACIITRDEEALLPDCIASIRPWVSEICVLDTGSRDGTIAIAKACGARVSTFPWRDDFADARNASIAMAAGDWIFVIDADERLREETGPALLRAAAAPGRLGYLVVREDLRPEGPPNELAILRLFRNRPDIRFRRPVHENVMDDLIALGAGSPEDSGVRLEHVGYLPEILKTRDKHGRNLKILKRRFKEAPDDLYNAYKLAVTLPPTARDEKRNVFAAAHGRIASMSVGAIAELPFLPRFFNAYAATLAAMGALDDAIRVAEEGLGLLPDSSQLLYRRGELARCAGDYGPAVDWLQRARQNPPDSLIAADRPEDFVVQCWVSLLAIEAVAPGRVELPLDHAPTHPGVFVGIVRLMISQGMVSEASAQFAPLMESYFHLHDVRLLAGEIAWKHRDFDTARSMWELTDSTTYWGHAAAAWRALDDFRRGEVAEMPDSPQDVSVAGLGMFLARRAGREITFNPAFDMDALANAASRWQLELETAGWIAPDNG